MLLYFIYYAYCRTTIIIKPAVACSTFNLWYSSIQTSHLNACRTRVSQEICRATHEFYASLWYNIIIQSLIHMSDVLVKCATRELCITLHVKCTHGYLWIRLPLILHNVRSIQTLLLAHMYRAWIISVQPFSYRINYSQYHPILLLTSQSKRNLSEHMLHTYLISTSSVKYWTILEDDWL